MPLNVAGSTRKIPITLARAALRLAPASRAAVLAIPELCVAAFFLSSFVSNSAGPYAPWFVLIVVLVGFAARAIDIESWSHLLPGGMVSRVRAAFGPRVAAAAAAPILLERLLLAALSSVVAGQYLTALLAVFGRAGSPAVTAVIAAVPVGLVWFRLRFGRAAEAKSVVPGLWLSAAVMLTVVVLGTASLLALDGRDDFWRLTRPSNTSGLVPPDALTLVVLWATGIGLALPALGAGEGLTRVASELPTPRVRSLGRVAMMVGLFGLVITVPLYFLFALLVPVSGAAQFSDAPLIAITLHATNGLWAARLLSCLVVTAAVMMLGFAVQTALIDAESTLSRLADEGVVPQALRLPHARFGTFTDTAAAGVLVAIVAGGAQVAWLAPAYGLAVAGAMAVKVAALARLRGRAPGPTFRMPVTLRIANRERPIGLWLFGAFVVLAGLSMVASGNAAAATAALVVSGLAIVLAFRAPTVTPDETAGEEVFELLPADESSLGHTARPGGLLVMVRNPHALTPLAAALDKAGGREIVVMTVRLVGNDAVDEHVGDSRPTASERELFTAVLALAKQHQKPVRLLILPAHDVFDAVVAAVLRLQVSEVHVGESATLSAAAQSKRVADAWDRAHHSRPIAIRLIIHHRIGRSDLFHLVWPRWE